MSFLDCLQQQQQPCIVGFIISREVQCMPMIALKGWKEVSGNILLQAAYIKHEVAEYYLKIGLYCKPYNRFPNLSPHDTVGRVILCRKRFCVLEDAA